MDSTQLTEIRKFLHTKRLPIDILMEVEDHFSAQIMELEKTGIGFGEAFSCVQSSWLSDLKMTYDVGYSLDDIAVITKNIIRQNRNAILKKALIATVLLLNVLIISKFFTTERQFFWLLTFIISACVLVPTVRFLLKLKTFQLPKKYTDFWLSIYQQNNAISIFGSAIYISQISHFGEISAKFHSLSSSEHIGFQLFSVFYIFFLIFINLYCFFNQNQYLKSISGVKNYLEKTRLA